MSEQEIFDIINNHKQKKPWWFDRYVEPMRSWYERNGSLDDWEKLFLISVIKENHMEIPGERWE